MPASYWRFMMAVGEASDDLAPGLLLWCRIVAVPELDGLVVRTPASQS